jgi:hypothetical protein
MQENGLKALFSLLFFFLCGLTALNAAVLRDPLYPLPDGFP